LDKAQVESLRKNLLTKNDTEKDGRRKDGKYLVEFYKNHVSEKAKQVIDGATPCSRGPLSSVYFEEATGEMKVLKVYAFSASFLG
jgi:hypothetical protein